MKRYFIRLDDASDHMDFHKWMRMKALLDRYKIKPIYGIIPNNMDPDLLKYEKVDGFWSLMREWASEGWIPAMHGNSHVFESNKGGVNPVNSRSEFAGLPIERQKDKVREGYKTLASNNIKANIFFAPAHTFDTNTLAALYTETPIRVISDTIANDVYFKDGFYFIPQQSGMVRNLPFQTVTFCYHPNRMNDGDFEILESFLKLYGKRFGCLKDTVRKRHRSLLDIVLKGCYFAIRVVRKR